MTTISFPKYQELGAYHWASTFGASTLWRFSPVVAAQYACPLRVAGLDRGPRGLRALDVGCGDGVMLHVLAQHRHTAIGVDAERSGLVLARQHRSAGGRMRPALLCGDAARIPLRSGSCDVVSAIEVIEHLEDPSAFLAEVRRVLRPKGVLVLTTPNAEQSNRVRDPFHVREFSPWELRHLLSSQFRHVRVIGARPRVLEQLYASATGWRPADLAVRFAFKLVSRWAWNPFVAVTTRKPDGNWALLVAAARL